MLKIEYLSFFADTSNTPKIANMIRSLHQTKTYYYETQIKKTYCKPIA